MEFCPECRNMLYLKIQNKEEEEEEEQDELVKYCKNCNYSKQEKSMKDTIYSINYNL